MLIACDEPAHDTTTVVRDSSGVTIIETTGSRRTAAPATILPEPLIVIGQTEGDLQYLLSRVVGALQLPNGNIVIANGATNELRLYDSTGIWMASLGRTGQGPGEYEYLRAIGRCHPGGFVGFDLHWQMNTYGGDATFKEKTPLRAPDGMSPYNLACDDQGHVLILGWGRESLQGPIIGFFATRDRLVLSNGTGAVMANFGERLVSERIGTERGSRPHPAGRATVFALHDGVVYVGSGERFELELFDLNGQLHTLLRGPPIPLQMTDSLKSAYSDWAVSRIPADRQPAVRSEIAQWQWPETFPAFTSVVIDDGGVAWVRAFNFDSRKPEVWSLFDPRRGYLGDLALQEGQSLLQAGRHHLLVLQRDSLDVESVMKLRIDRNNS